MEYQRDEHRVHLIVYHLIFCSKRRKPVLMGDVRVECERRIAEKCEQSGYEILRLAVMKDHVHLFVRANPSVSAADIAKGVKGYSAHYLRRNHKELLKMPAMWTRSYFASTAGNVSQETIDRYIEAQKGK